MKVWYTIPQSSRKWQMLITQMLLVWSKAPWGFPIFSFSSLYFHSRLGRIFLSPSESLSFLLSEENARSSQMSQSTTQEFRYIWSSGPDCTIDRMVRKSSLYFGQALPDSDCPSFGCSIQLNLDTCNRLCSFNGRLCTSMHPKREKVLCWEPADLSSRSTASRPAAKTQAVRF